MAAPLVESPTETAAPDTIEKYADEIESIKGLHPTMIGAFMAMGPRGQLLSMDVNHNVFKAQDCGKVLFLLLNGFQKSRDPHHQQLGLKMDPNAKQTKLDDEPIQLLAVDVKVSAETILLSLERHLCK